MYFLNEREIPHTTNFGQIIDLAKSLGVQYLNDSYVAENAAYRSERFMQEVVSTLGEVVIRDSIQASPFFALIVLKLPMWQ